MNPRPTSRTRWLRIGLAVAIVVVLIKAAGPGPMLEKVRDAQPMLLLLSFGAMTFGGLLRALNWSAMLRAILGARAVPVGQLTLHYLATAFLGSFIPSSAATDLLRTVASQRLVGGRMSFHAAATVMLNAVSWFVGCVLGLAAAVALAISGEVPAALLPLLGILAAISLGGPLLYALLGMRRDVAILALRRLGPRWYRIRHALRHFLDSVLVYTRSRSGLAGVMLVASGALLLQAAGFMLAGLALSVNPPLYVWVLLLPVAAFASLLPMSISGFGATQAAHALVLLAYGVPLAEAAAVATLIPAIGTAVRLVIGGAALPFAQDRTFRTDRGRSLN